MAILSQRSRLARNSVYSVIGFAVPAGAFLVFTPVLIKTMGASNYGLWVLGTTFVGVLGVFELGLSTALAKFVAQYRAEDDHERLSASVTMGYLVYLAAGSVLTVAMFLVAPYLAPLFAKGSVTDEEVRRILQIASLSILPLFLKNAGIAIPIGLQRFRVPMWLSVSQTILTLGLATAVALATGAVTLVTASTVLSLWLVALASLWLARGMLVEIGARVVFSWRQLRVISHFIVFTGLTSLGNVLFASLDRILVGAVAGVTAVAYYSVAVGIAINLLTIADVLTRPLMPAASSWASRGDWQLARTSLVKWTTGIALMESALLTIGLVLSGPLLAAWLGQSFAEAALTPVRVLLVIFAIAAVGAPAFQIANGTGFPWAPAAGGISSGIVTLGLIVVLLPLWGVAGAAVANIGAVLSLFPLVYMRRKLWR